MKAITAFHATTNAFERFHPLSHFGTAQAAQEVFGEEDGAKATLIEVELSILNPFEVEDCGGAWNLVDWIDDALAQGIVDDEQHSVMRGACDEVNTAENYPFQKATDLLVTALKARGYDGITYENQCEDVGSRSWVILHPDQVHVIRRSALREEVPSVAQTKK